eukprot:scaffold5339_cov134-Pinguiococcus_pyrenoidosus.AAC.1
MVSGKWAAPPPWKNPTHIGVHPTAVAFPSGIPASVRFRPHHWWKGKIPDPCSPYFPSCKISGTTVRGRGPLVFSGTKKRQNLKLVELKFIKKPPERRNDRWEERSSPVRPTLSMDNGSNRGIFFFSRAAAGKSSQKRARLLPHQQRKHTQGARIARIACPPLEKKARGSLERSPMHRRLRTTSKVELLAT